MKLLEGSDQASDQAQLFVSFIWFVPPCELMMWMLVLLLTHSPHLPPACSQLRGSDEASAFDAEEEHAMGLDLLVN